MAGSWVDELCDRETAAAGLICDLRVAVVAVVALWSLWAVVVVRGRIKSRVFHLLRGWVALEAARRDRVIVTQKQATQV